MLAALTGAAAAQSVPSGPATTLHLSATGSQTVAPDQIVATLMAQDTSANPAEAQRHVNALIAQGIQVAQPAPGFAVKVMYYQVFPSDEARTKWVAQQYLELRGGDGPGVLDLAGQLQQRGFLLASLGWELSPALRRQSYASAVTEALKALQEQAASAAAALNLRVDRIANVTIQPEATRPFLRMDPAAAGSFAAPQATPAADDVSASVSGEVSLRP